MPLDDLTRIYNRRELFSRLRQELARSRRSYIPFSIVMIDADHFKDVNDNYGHLRGDRVLVEIAQIIKNTCREMDIPCRYGGDEFAVIMPNTDSKAVIAASNRLLDKIRRHIFTGNEQPDLRITASIGAATYSDEINNADELIAKADQALYAAKKKGRNQCCDVTQINGRDTAPKLNFSRFVNRDNELSTLKETFMNTFEHQGRFTVVEGVAGIGKTRLINEFGSFIQLHDALLLASRPFEFGTTPPYHIFMQLIKQFIESNGHAYVNLLGRLLPVYKAELVKFVPELKITMNIYEEPSQLPTEYEKIRLFESVLQVFHLISQNGPIVLFCDDMQWAREADIEMLAYVVRNISSNSILACIAYRVEEIAIGHPLKRFLQVLSREHRLSRLTLKGLTYEDTVNKINTAIGLTAPEEIITRIYDETEGNPFYIEEILGTLIASNSLVWDGRNWKFQEFNKVILPDSISDLMRRRLSAIDPEIKELMNIASVIGYRFNFALLHHVTQKNEGHLIDLLDASIKYMLVELEDSDQYRFSSILLQRTLYEDVGNAKRIWMHNQIAQAIESMHGGKLVDVYESLAHHYLMAESWENAFNYNIKAAEKLKEIYAHQDAIKRYKNCLDLIEKGKIKDVGVEIKIIEELADIYTLLGDHITALKYYHDLRKYNDLPIEHKVKITRQLGLLCQRMGDLKKALDYYNKAREMLNPVEHAVEVAKCDQAAAWIYMKLGNYNDAFKLASQALAVFQQSENESEIADALNTIGTIHFEKGAWTNAEEFFMRSYEHRKNVNDPRGLSNSFNNLGNVFHQLAETDKAIDYHKRSLEIRKNTGDRVYYANSLNDLALLYAITGDWDKCLEMHNDALNIAQSLNIPDMVELCCSNLSFMMAKMEKYEEALAFSEKAMTLARLIQAINRQASVLNNTAIAYLGLGRIEEAEKVLEEAGKMIAEYELMGLKPENNRLRAEVEIKKGNIDKAITWLQNSRQTAEKLNSKEEITLCCLVMGRIELDRKNFDSAEKVLEECLEKAESMKNAYVIALALFYLGMLHKQKGNEQKMKGLFARAYEKFSKMEIQSYMEEIQKVMPELK